MAKITGFNDKEQKVFNKLKDGKSYDFRKLKELFWEEAKAHCRRVYEPGWGQYEIDSQAQSYARNSVRRLIRDGWVEQVGRGTYRLTKTGKKRISRGADVTPSALTSQRGKARKDKKAAKGKKTMRKKSDPKKVKALKKRVTKEAVKTKTAAKAKKAASRAARSEGNPKKIKETSSRITAEQTIEEKLAFATAS